MKISDLALDVSGFTIEHYGFSQQALLSAVVLCPVKYLEQAWKMGQHATLVINQGAHERYFHGILVMEQNALGTKAPQGYIASNVKIMSHFWFLSQTHTHCMLYDTDCAEFIDSMIKASGLTKAHFTCSALPTQKRKLRSADGERWLDLINHELSIEKVLTRSLHNKSHEVIEFCGDINQLYNGPDDKPRKLICVEKRYVDEHINDVYFHFSTKYQQTKHGIETEYELKVPDFNVYPGQWLKLENGLY